MNIDKEREAFEAWRAERYAQTTPWSDDLGEYPDDFTQGQWKAFKGGIRAALDEHKGDGK